MDILSYVMGQKSAGAGGGDNAVQVNMIWDDSSEAYTLDKTYEEIAGLIAEGKFLYIVGHNTGAVMTLTDCSGYGDIYFASAPRGARNAGKAFAFELIVSSQNEVVTYTTQFTAQSTEDGG